MINSNNKFKSSLLVVILILPIVWLYYYSELDNSRKAHEIESLLLDITQVETQLTEYVLKNRSHLTLHYDDIANSQSRLNTFIKKLIYMLDENIDISSNQLEHINVLHRKTQNIIERFKSINGQISQRQRYIKISADQIKESLKSDFYDVVDQINTITVMVFKARMFGESLLEPKLMSTIEQLKIHEKHCSLESHALIKTFLVHVNEMAKLEVKEAAILNGLFKHEMRFEIQKIRKSLVDSKFEMIKNSNMNQRYFAIYASILLLLIVFFILNNIKIQRNASLHKKRSEVDSLTKLKNRRRFIEDLENVIVNQSGALLFIDLDGFKLVNDQLGHHVGDKALKTLADKLKQFIDSIISEDFSAQAYRLGGDEFVISIINSSKHHDLTQLKRFAAQIVNSCEFSMSNQYGLSVSVGVALYPEHGVDVATVLHCADKAMYYSKSNGRNQFTFYNDINSND